MAYTPHNFEPGDTLPAEIFNELEQTVHDLGGAYIDFNDYMPISDLYTSMCSVVVTETGCICIRKADNKMLERYDAISKLYKLKVIDLYSVFGVCATNLTSFYPASANVHPNKPGMLRIGELVAGAIQGWIK